MSKKKQLNVSKKLAVTSPKDSSTLPPKNPELVSPAVNISENPSTEFQNAIHESKQHIAAHEEEKIRFGRRGRKKLPRDANGNIIREPVPPAAQPILNQASVAETKALLLGFVIPMASGAAVKYALGAPEAAIPEEHKEPWATAAAEELEAWFPGLSTKYMRLGTVIGFPVIWFINAKNIRADSLKALIEAEKEKSRVEESGHLSVSEK